VSNESKRDILKKTEIVDELKRSVKSNDRNSRNSRVSDRVHNHLKEKYGSYSNGINTLALKDMGEL